MLPSESMTPKEMRGGGALSRQIIMIAEEPNLGVTLEPFRCNDDVKV